MWFLILLLAIVLAICALCAWPPPGPDQEAAEAGRPAAEPEPDPESLEGVLVRQLMAGEITKSQYQRAAGGIAARDDDRHPLTVPPEGDPDGG